MSQPPPIVRSSVAHVHLIFTPLVNENAEVYSLGEIMDAINRKVRVRVGESGGARLSVPSQKAPDYSAMYGTIC